MFERIKTGDFDAVLSNTVFEEIGGCSPTMQDKLLAHIAGIRFELQDINETVLFLSRKIIDDKILPPRSVNDGLHIAAAVVAGCDYLVSWNMRHIANVRTNKGMRLFTISEGFKEIMLLPPSMLHLGGEADEGIVPVHA